MSCGRARRRRGFTLVELLIALAIVGALLAIAFGGLRVALGAWRQGEDRAEAHQHVRSIALILARARRGRLSVPGLARPGARARRALRGHRAARWSSSPRRRPFPRPIPIAFTAVVFGLDESGEGRAWSSASGRCPTGSPFTRGARSSIAIPASTALEFAYLDDGRLAGHLGRRPSPRPCRAPCGSRVATRSTAAEELPPLTVLLRTAPPNDPAASRDDGSGLRAGRGAAGARLRRRASAPSSRTRCGWRPPPRASTRRR